MNIDRFNSLRKHDYIGDFHIKQYLADRVYISDISTWEYRLSVCCTDDDLYLAEIQQNSFGYDEEVYKGTYMLTQDEAQDLAKRLDSLKPIEDALDVSAHIENYDRIMHTLVSISPVPIRFEAAIDEVGGYYQHSPKQIVIRNNTAKFDIIYNTLHELGHAMLDHNHSIPKQIEEYQANLIAEICIHDLFKNGIMGQHNIAMLHGEDVRQMWIGMTAARLHQEWCSQVVFDETYDIQVDEVSAILMNKFDIAWNSNTETSMVKIWAQSSLVRLCEESNNKLLKILREVSRKEQYYNPEWDAEFLFAEYQKNGEEGYNAMKELLEDEKKMRESRLNH